MRKKLSNIFLSLLLCTVLLAGTVTESYAQSSGNDGVITLIDLGKTQVSLDGPFDSSSVTFGLPAEWKLTGDAQIDLSLTTSFNSTSQTDNLQVFGGTLTVTFNRIIIANLALNEQGTFDYVIPIPAALLVSPRLDGQMELKFILDSGISCVANQRMNVIINPTSRISFHYEAQKPDTSLTNFPRPIVQSTIFPDLALLVIPDKPSAMELQSALTVASGLGNLSGGKLGLELVTNSQLTDAQKAASHLIYVGKSASIPALSQFPLPFNVQQGAFVFSKGSEDNGVIEMINSPWATQKAVLIVSGNSDLGTLKAAQAVSTGTFQENASPNLAIVEDILDTPVATSLITDQTFADLGYSANQFTSRGVNSQSYKFYLPFGTSLSTDAYLELAFGHSALLNYDISGLVILLNGQPIGSARFDDVSANQAVNRNRISIPPSVAIPGDNVIEIRANLEPLDNCADPNLRGLWAVIWPDSRVHLPFTSVTPNPQLTLDLSAYPAPLIFDPTLETTAVIFQRNDIESLRSFIHVASYLGNQSNGNITKLGVFYDDELLGTDLSSYNLIVVGRPSQLTIMDQLNTLLPVPFAKGSDLTEGRFLQVTYQVSPDAPVGYVELMPSPWNSEKVLITAFGNNNAGVNLGVSSLVDPILRSQLAGDFALVDKTRVQTVDTRLAVAISNPSVVQVDIPTAVAQTNSPSTVLAGSKSPAWLLPLLILAIILIIVVVVIASIANSRNRRKNS